MGKGIYKQIEIPHIGEREFSSIDCFNLIIDFTKTIFSGKETNEKLITNKNDK